MKVTFIKPYRQYAEGDTAELEEQLAKHLILLDYAKEHTVGQPKSDADIQAKGKNKESDN
jgi:hypothetical protein